MSARTALYAPAHRVLARTAPGSSGAPADAAPSIDYGGSGIQDPRLPYNFANSATGAGLLGWLATGDLKCISQVPSAISTTNIAAAQHTTNGTALTLVGSTGSGITVVGASGAIVFPNYSNLIPAGACAIDGLPAFIRVGNHSRTCFYNPATFISRGVSITGIAGGAGGSFTIKGVDAYGYPMTQTIAVAAGANTVTTTKTFKFVLSVTPAFTDGTGTYSVGTSDLYGFPVACDYFSDCTIYWNNAVQVFSTFTPAVTATASATTGDVRGTFAAPSASDGTKRLDIYVEPSVSRVTTIPMYIGLFGVTQF